jgi:VanZ family protein
MPRIYRSVFFILLIAVGCLALTPAPPPQLSFGWDKANHMVAFAVLAFTCDKAFRAGSLQRIGGALALALYGGGIEIAQKFVPTRSSEWGDLLADIVGIAIGVGLSSVLTMRRHR